MLVLAIISLAGGGWFYFAALSQNQGHAFADQTCASMPSFCDAPNTVLIASIVIATALFVFHLIRAS